MSHDRAADEAGASRPGAAGLGTARRSEWISQGLEVLLAQQPARGDTSRLPQDDIDVLIIGSGYGGAVAASRLAGKHVQDGHSRRPLRVVMLERGREYLAGAFPSRAADLPGHLRFTTPHGDGAKGRLQGLFDLRVGEDMSVVLANGVGGGSLINAGVMALPNADVFGPNEGWPAALPAYAEFKHRAQALRVQLGAQPWQDAPQAGPLPRTEFMRKLAAERVPISVASRAGPNSAGVMLNACIGCGDCATGCNHGAKDSLDLNLLAQAHQQGLALYAGATVSRIRRCPGGWEAEVWHTDAALRQRMARGQWVHAKRIILAAGTLGSTEILLRSQTDSLQFSQQLGQRFSGNGDVLAMAYGADQRVNGVADEDLPAAGRQVGPTITSMIDLRAQQGLVEKGLVVQDLAVPGPLRRLFEEAATTCNLLQQLDQEDQTTHAPSGPEADPQAVDPAKIDCSLALALIYRDKAQGQMTAAPDDPHLPRDAGVRITWLAARDDGRIQTAHDLMAHRLGAAPATPEIKGLARPPGAPSARLLPNPMWQLLPPRVADLLGSKPGPLVTVHPLGGCRMADHPDCGVVNHLGQVFNTTLQPPPGPPPLHEGLVVLDGAIVPCALGINPALTIATLASLALDGLIKAWRLTDPVAGAVAGAVAGSAAGAVAGSAAGSASSHPAAPAGAAPPPLPPPTPTHRPVFRVLPAVAATPVKTQVQVIERLAGCVDLAPGGPGPAGSFWVELDLVYQPADLFPDAPGQRRPAYTANGHSLNVAPDPQLSRLRIFAKPGSPFDTSRPDNEALFVAPLAEGSRLRFFHREASAPRQRRWRTLAAWAPNRGLRDSWQAAVEWATRSGPAHLNLCERVRQACALASRGGEVRLFDYALQLGPVSQATAGFEALATQTGLRIDGQKRFSYTRRGNPWQQLMQMQLSTLAGLPLGTRRMISVQPAYFASKRMPLMRVVAQQDQPTALIDQLAFGAYLARVFLNVHLWSMRKPDAPKPPPQPQRLPGWLLGLGEPTVYQFKPDGAQDDAQIRLTTWPRPDQAHGRRPVLMIHGYSASGTTFAHPKLAPGLAAHLWEHGFEPWVLDLRSSSGMPSADRPYTFEEIALADIPAAVRKVCQVSGCDKIDIVSHCMGSAMLAMTLQAPAPCGPETAARIGRWVMSQFGPRLRFSPANMLRAYLISYFREALPDYRYSLTPGDDVPGVDGGLYDRFINTMPYLGQGTSSEFDIENPWVQIWRRTPWVGTRHRLDALIGRTFDARQLSPEVLAHIDDFFGPINLRTMSQPIFFAQMGEVAGTLGLDPFGRDAAPLLRQVPMLSLHGLRNGLADPETATLLRQWADASELDLQQRRFAQHGHQDLLIGRDCSKVFNIISLFLQGKDLPAEETDDGGPSA